MFATTTVDASLVRLRRIISAMNVNSELDRLQSEFGWRPEAVALSDVATGVWTNSRFRPEKSVYSDSQWTEFDVHLDESWWYNTRNKIILDGLRRHFLGGVLWDIGCGSGVVGKFLRDNGFEVMGIEPSAAGATLAARRGITTFQGNLQDLSLPGNSIGAISMFDVLEHLENRQSALAEIHRVLQPEGLLFLSLPALQLLWSQFDEDGGHFLRYNKRVIRQELAENGFQIVESRYFFVLTVIPLLVLRVIPYRFGMRRALATGATLSAAGGMLGRISSWAEQRWTSRAPFGSSLFVVARKM